MPPECVLFDGWYSGLENLKAVRGHGWHWLTRLKSNRRVNPDRSGLRAVSACDVAETGTVVHLEGYGPVPFGSAQGEVFRIDAKDGTADHWATDDLAMDDLGRVRLAEASWRIEEYHRGLKQTTLRLRSGPSSGASAGSAGPSGATSGWRCGRSWPWSGTASAPASTG